MTEHKNIRKKLSDLIAEKGYTCNSLSLRLGKNQTYLQKFIKYGTPKEFDEETRRKLSNILEVPEQELTNIPLKKSVAAIDEKALAFVLKTVDKLLDEDGITLEYEDKAELSSLIYSEIIGVPDEKKTGTVIDFYKVYNRLKKAN